MHCLKIAFVLPSFPEISETFILNQITGLIDRGHQVDIFAMKPGNTERVHAGVTRYGLLERTSYIGVIPRNRIVRLGKAIALLSRNYRYLNPSVLMKSLNVRKYGRAASSLSLLFQAVPLLRDGQYDIIHCQFGDLGPRVLQLKQIGAVSGKLIASFRGYDVTKYLKKRPGVYDELFREGDLFLPVSSSLAKLLVGAGCPDEKIRVLHSGIECSKFPLAERSWSCNAAGPAKVLTVARLVEKKGIAFALKAVARVLAAGKRITYTVVGDGPLRGELERLIRELGIENEATLVGWRVHDEVIQLMRDSHVLLAPSITAEDGDQEGIPNVIKEAMALGMPVIGTAHSGIPELVRDGVTGYLVPERNEAALAEKLSGLLDHPGKQRELGIAGRKAVEDSFDREKLNDALVAAYQSLLDDGSAIAEY